MGRVFWKLSERVAGDQSADRENRSRDRWDGVWALRVEWGVDCGSGGKSKMIFQNEIKIVIFVKNNCTLPKGECHDSISKNRRHKGEYRHH